MPSRSVALVLSTIAAGLVALGCRPPPPPPPPPPVADPPAVAEIVEWLLGEQLRGSKTRNHGAPLGIVTIDLGPGPIAEGTLRPGSCAPDLVSIIPVVGRPHEWLGVNKAGVLLRYSGQGWNLVPAKMAVPPIAKLLGFATKMPNALLVHPQDNGQELWQLTLSDGVVTGIQSIDPSSFTRRPAALERFDSRRCLDGIRDCLHLVEINHEVLLEREPMMYGNWVPITSLGNSTVRDVRYVDPAGKRLAVLTDARCEPATPTSEPPSSAHVPAPVP